MVEVAVTAEESVVLEEAVGNCFLTHLYVHKSSIRYLSLELRMLIAEALLIAGEFNFDLVKVAHDNSHICLLSYPDFITNAHPKLHSSVKVLMGSKRVCVTDYTSDPNPPILHRKELFISKGHPAYEKFSSLTRAEEAHGLLKRPDISRHKQWLSALASKNLVIKNHSLIAKPAKESKECSKNFPMTPVAEPSYLTVIQK